MQIDSVMLVLDVGTCGIKLLEPVHGVINGWWHQGTTYLQKIDFESEERSGSLRSVLAAQPKRASKTKL